MVLLAYRVARAARGRLNISGTGSRPDLRMPGIGASTDKKTAGSAPANILLVDDTPSKLLTYEIVLAELGENLIKASSVEDALGILLKTDVALLLTELTDPRFPPAGDPPSRPGPRVADPDQPAAAGGPRIPVTWVPAAEPVENFCFPMRKNHSSRTPTGQKVAPKELCAPHRSCRSLAWAIGAQVFFRNSFPC